MRKEIHPPPPAVIPVFTSSFRTPPSRFRDRSASIWVGSNPFEFRSCCNNVNKSAKVKAFLKNAKKNQWSGVGPDQAEFLDRITGSTGSLILFIQLILSKIFNIIYSIPINSDRNTGIFWVKKL